MSAEWCIGQHYMCRNGNIKFQRGLSKSKPRAEHRRSSQALEWEYCTDHHRYNLSEVPSMVQIAAEKQKRAPTNQAMHFSC